MRHPLAGFLAGLQFLTRLPVPPGEYALSDAVIWLPVVGLVLGVGLALIDQSLRWLEVPSLLNTAVLVVALLALTGALHADGLIDTADAVFSHATPERRLEIMRDPHIGAFGAVALVSIVALKIAALDSLSGVTRTGLLILAPTLGRWSIVLLATVFPYGRASGLGSPLKAAATPAAFAVATMVPLVACAVDGPVGWASGAVALVAALGIGRWLLRLLPGLTGDCYGAVCEVVELLAWLTGAVALPRLAA